MNENRKNELIRRWAELKQKQERAQYRVDALQYEINSINSQLEEAEEKEEQSRQLQKLQDAPPATATIQ